MAKKRKAAKEYAPVRGRAADQPIVDSGTVIREHVRELRAKTGKKPRRASTKTAAMTRRGRG